MVFAKSIGLLMAIVACSVAFRFDNSEEFIQIFGKCNEANGLTFEDWSKYVDKTHDLPEKHLCVEKCLYEATKILDEAGNFKHDIYKEQAMKFIKDDPKLIEDLVECTKDIEKITNCDGIRVLAKCEDEIFPD